MPKFMSEILREQQINNDEIRRAYNIKSGTELDGSEWY